MWKEVNFQLKRIEITDAKKQASSETKDFLVFLRSQVLMHTYSQKTFLPENFI